MQDTSKLMLTIVAGGALMGAWLAQMASPVMQFAAQPEWRTRLQPDFSATPLQFVDAGPRDLSPFGWTPGLLPASHLAIPEPALPEPVEQALDEAAVTAEALEDQAVRIEPPQPAISVSFDNLPAVASDPAVETGYTVQ